MIVCPNCGLVLSDNNVDLICKKCDYIAHNIDGVLFFNSEIKDDFSDYNSKHLEYLHRAEERIFWFKNRKDIIKNIFNKYIGKTESIIEVGAGTGNVSKMLFEEGYDIAVGEIYKKGLDYAKRYGIRECYQFNILDSPFVNHFNVVCLFDVLEHIEDDRAVLKKTYQMLKDDGKIVLTVPAHEWLWSSEDVIASHKRRYTLKKLKDLLNDNGYEILTSKHFFIFIVPLLYLRVIFSRGEGSITKKYFITWDESKIFSLINEIFYVIIKIENYLLKNFSFPFGGSIIVVARKRAIPNQA